MTDPAASDAAETAPAAAPAAPAGRAPRARRMPGLTPARRADGAGVGWLVLVTLAVGMAAGVVWGLVRPTQGMRVRAGGALTFEPVGLESGFVGYLMLLGLAAILGLAVAALAFHRLPGRRGALTLLLVGVVAGLGALTVYGVGELVAGLRQPDVSNLRVGQPVAVVPPVTGLLNLLIGPFTGMLAYWCALLFAPGVGGAPAAAEGVAEDAAQAGEPAGPAGPADPAGPARG